MTALRELDERHLPGAAVRLRAWMDRAASRRDQVRELAASFEPASLDSRYGGLGLFRVLVARPVVGLVVSALVLTAGVGVAVVREGSDDTGASRGSSTELSPQGDLPHGALLGPSIGDGVRTYINDATQGLVDAVRDAPNAPRVALVGFSDYRTPEQAAALLSGFTTSRAFLRAKAAGREAAALPVDIRGDLLTALRTAYASTSKSRKEAQRSYQGYVDTLRPNSTQDKAFRKLYAAFAKASGIEAREYGNDCACVYAALVTATPTVLLSLHARPGVRVVELAASGLSVLQVQVQPLLPEVDGVVPRPSVGAAS
jgi:hypothetical protein